MIKRNEDQEGIRHEVILCYYFDKLIVLIGEMEYYWQACQWAIYDKNNKEHSNHIDATEYQKFTESRELVEYIEARNWEINRSTSD